ncbi:unnamed protein product [Urochloa decumbens]|uniref:Uncharacterized protein n=1 Tax=Urochloa decumbens TaxID=240449 RepID=A0ABC9CHI5_9POAL
MALRSLVVKLKDLPRRIPVSGAFAPKEIPWSSSCARLIDPAKYGSTEEMARAIGPLLEQNMKLDREAHRKRMRVYDRNTALMAVFCFGSLGYMLSHI